MQRIIILVLLSASLSVSAQTTVPGIVEKDFDAYLFAYFTGNTASEEAVRYAVSPDGYNYFTLNGNKPVLDSKKISSTGGVRDPHILRSLDGRRFYMVLTDMVSANGWDSNRAMILLKSDNLVDWSSSIVNISKKYAGQQSLKSVWAPQTIYDPHAGKYMIYWSMKHGDAPDIIYYAYANDEFTDIEGEPKPLFVPKNGKFCIDADIVYRDGLFHMFYKTEDHNDGGIKKATTASLSSGVWQESDKFFQQTDNAVEGAALFKLINKESYILMYDVYKKGSYQFLRGDDLDNFEIIDKNVSMDFKPRHGTVVPITRRELNLLLDKWGKPASFSYKMRNNPVLDGYYADPDILYSNKTERYYLYPTSDGYNNWSGNYFKTFSSTDLSQWRDEGVILDLKRDVSWATANAWAPSIIEKKIGDNYRYFYYFTAGQKIGVAVSDNPTGPFVDSGNALISSMPVGASVGQQIDPDVFLDPVSGKSYLYWGNGYAAVVELNDDMMSIKPNTMKIITPDSTFREAIHVFYRKGTYYFMWSENDTRSEDYRVRYGTSKSATGTIIVPHNNLILSKNQGEGIYGTGHNSVIQIPGTDQWRIVYHRFSYPNGIKMGDPAGYNREVCIDKMEFEPDGSIIRINPTH